MITALPDMATQVEATRLMVYKPHGRGAALPEGSHRHTKEASMAKLFAGDTAIWVAERAINVGGYGYTTDFLI